MNTSELIQPRHLDRKAMIYVRQSSPNQVITNKESQRMQYALRERAAAFGWHEQDTNVIDADLGRSGTTVEQREGFQHLVAQIALDAEQTREYFRQKDCYPESRRSESTSS